MYPKGINHGGLGMKNAGGKLIGSGKGQMTSAEHNAMMAMVAPEVAKKVYNMLEKGKK
jgi:hypothetical protein